MSADQFRTEIAAVLDRIWTTQMDAIRRAAAMMAESVARGGLVHLFGSGHSVLPVQDVFPRYGSYPDDRGAMLNLLGVFFGVGALIVPLLASSITLQVLIIATALAVLCTIFYAILPFPPARESAGFSIFASIRAVKYPGVLLFALLLFCESGNESAIAGWTSTYAGSLGAAPRVATWILAAYWAGLMIGRIAGARLLAIMRKERLVFASGVGSAIGTAILLGGPSLITLAIGAAIIGLSFAAIYPTTLAIAADRYQRLAGTIFGLLFAVGLIGGMLFPFAIGHLSEHYGMRAAMLLPLVGALAIVLFAATIARK